MKRGREGGGNDSGGARARVVAVIGGTGDLGLGLAVRLARNYDVDHRLAQQVQGGGGGLEGLRDSPGAGSAVGRTGPAIRGSANRHPGHPGPALGRGADLSLKPNLGRGSWCYRPSWPMELQDGQFVPALADRVGRREGRLACRGSRVAGAFHTVPRRRGLLEAGRELDYDVLVTAETAGCLRRGRRGRLEHRPPPSPVRGAAEELQDGRGHHAEPPQRRQAQQAQVPLDQVRLRVRGRLSGASPSRSRGWGGESSKVQ